jgi:hypothetical protein
MNKNINLPEKVGLFFCLFLILEYAYKAVFLLLKALLWFWCIFYRLTYKTAIRAKYGLIRGIVQSAQKAGVFSKKVCAKFFYFFCELLHSPHSPIFFTFFIKNS